MATLQSLSSLADVDRQTIEEIAAALTAGWHGTGRITRASMQPRRCSWPEISIRTSGRANHES